MKNLNVLTLAMLVGISSSVVANYNDNNKGMHPHHSSRHMRRHSDDAKGGKNMKKTKTTKKETKSSKKMKGDGQNTRRRHVTKSQKMA